MTSTPDPDTLPPRRVLLALAALLAVLWFGVLGVRDLVPTDEGRYAEIAREMVVSGDWVTPRLDGFKYFEKPPLQYWATALAYEAFGLGDWQARLWTALCGFYGLAFAGYAGLRLFGARAGLYATAVLGSSLYWVLLGHINTLDMSVAAFLCGSLFAFLLAQRPGADAAQTRGWMWACWANMALALLSKGLIGLLFPGGTLVLATLLRRDWALWRRLHLGSGLGVFLALALPWHVLVQLRNPEFLDFYIVFQQFERFLTPALARPGPWYYFVPILLLGLLPWLGALPRLLRRSPRDLAAVPADGAGAARQVLLLWSALIFLFFSASHSKLPSYILPMFPALAVLIGADLAAAPPRTRRRVFALAAAVIAAAALGVTQIGRAGNATTPAALYRQFGIWLEAGLLAALPAALLAWRAEWRARRTAAVLLLAGGALVALTVGGQAFQILGRTVSTRDVVAAIGPWRHAGQPFYTVQTYDQTLPFYLQRRVTVVDYRGELDFGIRQQPQDWVASLPAFAARWRTDRLPLAFVPVERMAALRALDLPLRVIDRTTRYVVIARPDQDYGAAATAAQTRLPAAWNEEMRR